jgi:Uma2 family endonuclease
MTAAATLPIRITYEDFKTFPDDGRRYELIDGEVYVFATPTRLHQGVSGRLYVRFDQAITPDALGWIYAAPMEVKFPGESAVQPDLIVVLRDRAHALTESGIQGTPSLLLEILSPSTRAYDLTTKAELYARHGAPEYWVVDLDAKTITVNELRRDGQYVPLPNDGFARSLIIPDLVVDVRTLFAEARSPH